MAAVLNKSIFEDIFKEIVQTSSPTSSDDPKQNELLSTFFLSGKQCANALVHYFSEIKEINLSDNYLYIPIHDYFVRSEFPFYNFISVTIGGCSNLKVLNLRTSHPRCLPLLNAIKQDLTRLHIKREILENEGCFEALSNISTQKLTIDADNMGNKLLKILPITATELEINGLAFDKEDEDVIENPKLCAVEKFGIREYEIKHDEEFDLPELITAYRKIFPNAKNFDLMFYTLADLNSNILRHFNNKCVKALRKNNPNVHIRIYIDVEFTKDVPMSPEYRNQLREKMELIEGFYGAKKFLQISNKISMELFVAF